MRPRFLITLDEQLNNLPVTVRVGQAVDPARMDLRRVRAREQRHAFQAFQREADIVLNLLRRSICLWPVCWRDLLF